MKIVKIVNKKSVHTSVDDKIYKAVEVLAKKHGHDKCAVFNSLLTLGLAAHTRHAKKSAKVRTYARSTK